MRKTKEKVLTVHFKNMNKNNKPYPKKMSNPQTNPAPTPTQVNEIVDLALNSPSPQLRHTNETLLLTLRRSALGDVNTIDKFIVDGMDMLSSRPQTVS